MAKDYLESGPFRRLPAGRALEQTRESVRASVDAGLMADLSWSPGLCAVFGTDHLDGSGQIIDALLAVPVAERTDLDFKSKPYADGKVRDLAVDVAAFANSVGGVILIGVSEREGVAAGVVPVAPAIRDSEELRIRSAVASWISPVPEVATEWLVVDGGGVMAIIVPPSPRAPHGVPRSGSPKEPNWCWPRRHGTSSRYLSEPEIAGAYAARIDRRSNLLARVDDIEGLVRSELRGGDDQRWMIGTLVPTIPGSFRPGDWNATRLSSEVLMPSFRKPPEQRFANTHHDVVSHRLRRLRIGRASTGSGDPVTEVHVDGAVCTAQPVTFRGETFAPHERERLATTVPTRAPQEWVFRALTRTLGTLVSYATEVAGAGGSDSAMRIRFDLAGAEIGYFHHGSFFEPIGTGEDMQVDLAISLGSASTDAGYRSLFVELARDIWNGMGQPACGYLTEDGALTNEAMRLLERH